MLEAEITTNLVKSMGDVGLWAYKIPDDMAGTSFSLRRPFDIVVNARGKFVAVEVKRTRGLCAFGLRAFQEHQPMELDKVLAHGGKAYVFLVAWSPRELNDLFIFDWSRWGERIKSGESIKARELAAMEAIRGRKGRYEISSWARQVSGMAKALEVL